VPSKHMGDITSDLNGRRGRVQDVQAMGSLQVIRAQVPLAEISKYSTELRSMTAGEGSYTIEFSHYDAVPALIQKQIIAKAQAKQEEKRG
jgi:elongation factor G